MTDKVCGAGERHATMENRSCGLLRSILEGFARIHMCPVSHNLRLPKFTDLACSLHRTCQAHRVQTPIQLASRATRRRMIASTRVNCGLCDCILQQRGRAQLRCSRRNLRGSRRPTIMTRLQGHVVSFVKVTGDAHRNLSSFTGS